MNEPPSSQAPSEPAGRQESMSALFANLVVQQTNMTLMLLGRMPHPETQETLRDIEGARLLIDQLEMLEFKTRGNLDPREDRLLKQSLTALRMAFVEAIDGRAGEPTSPASSSADANAPGETVKGPSVAHPSVSSPEDESRKKFTKKY